MRSMLIFALPLLLLAMIGVAPAETHIPGGDVYGRWEMSGSPYYVDSTVNIPNDSTLIIEHGCTIILAGEVQFDIKRNAVLKAIGTATDSIIFTNQDSSILWKGLNFRASAEGCTLNYCRVEFSDSAGIICKSCSPVIINSKVSNNNDGGIYCSRGDPIIVGNKILNNNARFSGGGICCDRASPSITNNTIANNHAFCGAGLYCSNRSSSTVTDNIISNNNASSYGGGVFCDHGTPVIEHNIISHNSAEEGGGIWCGTSSSPKVTNNIISHNSADYGAGVHCDDNSPMISGNRIVTNNANFYGGGICCVGVGKPVIINNILSGNSAKAGGGVGAVGSSPVIMNSTISNNSTSVSGGGLLATECTELIVFNTILHENYADTAGNQGAQIYLDSSDLYVAYTDVDSTECYVKSDSGEIVWGTGNINSDPLFCDTLFHLSETSSCIDAGAGSLYVTIWDTMIYAPSTDYDSNKRPFGDDWDMGAFEYDSATFIKEIVSALVFQPEITVSPNPFMSSCLITMDGTSEQQVAPIAIYDLEGSCVAQFDKVPCLWRPGEKISNGVYLIQVKFGPRILTDRAVLIR